MDNAKQEMLDIIDCIRNPSYNRLGARLPRGVLLSGHPGVGKSMLSRALANECQLPVFMTCASSFVDLYVGRGASNIRNLFSSASKSPAIIFIDEIDAIGKTRGGVNSHDEREQTLNQLLFEMDNNTSILVIGATNRIDDLDPALTRAGRFDRHIFIHNPDYNDRIKIFRHYTSKIQINSDTDIGELAELTDGMTGAAIESIVNDSCFIACRANSSQVRAEDVKIAISRQKYGILN